jgi:hypothetical protein
VIGLMAPMKRACIAALASGIVACGGAGSYGHAPHYEPTASERDAVAGAHEYDALHARARAGDPRGRNVTLFGVVETREVGSGGQALLKLSVRALEPNSVCARPGDDDSCRVTVTDQDFGVVWALVALRADDDVGPHAVGQRSLLRLVGDVEQDVSPTDGAPVVHCTWYRHWPSLEYVTRSTGHAAGP